MIAVLSKEGERLLLPEEPNASARASERSTEKWLQTIEERVRVALEEQIFAAFNELTSAGLTAAWCSKWTSQAALAACQLYWTASVTVALNDGGADLVDLCATLDGHIRIILSEIATQALSAYHRTALVSLLALASHQRDVLLELCNGQTSEVEAFEWLLQLRYVWEHPTAPASFARRDTREAKRITVRALYMSIAYARFAAPCRDSLEIASHLPHRAGTRYS